MTRHFIHIDGRRVHYRRWGEGPAVLAIHGSPQSSRAVETMALACVARGLCVIAPDTPGNGLSTPLAGSPSSEDYARALARLADALGLGRVGLHGYHTGAATICAFAALYPDRVSALVFQGLSCWTPAENATLPVTYLPPFIPSWDGSHMTWAWARLEEQTVFFPWTDPVPASRMEYDVPSLPAIHTNAIDFLDSGDGYRAPYAAAFRFRTEEWFSRVKAPFLLCVAALDPLRPHLARPPLSEAPSRIFDDVPTLAAEGAALLAAHPGDAAPPPPESGADCEGLARGFTEGIAWRGRLSDDGRPLVLLHGAGGSSRIFDSVIGEVARHRPVVSLDLPGHGATADGWSGDAVSSSDFVADACKALGFDRPAMAGYRFGAGLAASLVANGAATAAASLGPLAPPSSDPVDMAAPSLAPEWDGAHLLRAFRIARWERLFEPWYRRDRAHAIPQGNLDPADIHARAIDLVKAGTYWPAAVAAERHFAAGAYAEVETVPATAAALADFAA